MGGGVVDRVSSSVKSRRSGVRWKVAGAVVGVVAVLAIRIWFCCLAPAETTDVLRNIGYGQAFWSHGLTIYDRTPAELGPWQDWQSKSGGWWSFSE